MADDKKFAEAIRAAAEYKPLAGDWPDDLLVAAYDRWARALAREKKWKEAMDKYAEGLKALPKNDRLTSNATAIVDEWAGEAVDRKDLKEAVRIYEVGLTYLPGNGHLEHNKKVFEERMKK